MDGYGRGKRNPFAFVGRWVEAYRNQEEGVQEIQGYGFKYVEANDPTTRLETTVKITFVGDLRLFGGLDLGS